MKAAIKRKANEDKHDQIDRAASGVDHANATDLDPTPLLEQTDELCERINKFFDDIAEEDSRTIEGVPALVIKKILMRNSECACQALRAHLKAKK